MADGYDFHTNYTFPDRPRMATPVGANITDVEAERLFRASLDAEDKRHQSTMHNNRGELLKFLTCASCGGVFPCFERVLIDKFRILDGAVRGLSYAQAVATWPIRDEVWSDG